MDKAVENSPDDEIATLRRRATWASIGVASTLILIKLAAYVSTGSVALLSSLIDSTVDLFASLVIFVGVRYALQPADVTHRYGHGKSEPLAAMAQALFIIGSAVFLFYEGVNRLINPEPVRHGWIGMAAIGVALLLTLALILYQGHVMRRTGSVAIGADQLHYTADVGMNFAVLVALLLVQQTGWPYFDPLFALAIAAYLIYGARGIAGRSFDMLMDRELPPDDRRRIREIVMAHSETRGVHDMRTRDAGDRVFVEFHLELDRHLTLEEAHEITDVVENEVMDAFANAEVLIHQEPEGLEDERLDLRLRRETEKTRSARAAVKASNRAALPYLAGLATACLAGIAAVVYFVAAG